VQDYVGPIRKYTAEWMGLPAAQIRRNEVRKALVHVGQTVSPIRADKLKGFISIAFKWALDTDFDSNLHQNPVHGITVEGLNRRPKRPDILTGEEIRHLLSSAKTIQSPWYPVWAMAVMTGMRSGELYALLWKDVDFTSDQISVTKSYSKKAMVKERDKYPDGIKSTKTEEWRHIPISTDLKDFLVELRRKTGHTSHVLPRIAAWGYGSQAAVLKEFCRCIEIKPVVFHALRACFAVQMLQSGVPAVTAMAIGGWEDMKTMMRYVRMAGVETKGATQNLKLLPPKDAMATVLKFTGQSGG
jgi:integrase